MIKRNKYALTFKIKLKAIIKILKSDKFALLDFERTDKYNGAIEGLFTKGFAASDLNCMMEIAQKIQSTHITEDVKAESVVEEAKKLILS